MTPQMFADRLHSSDVQLGDIALLVLDECHDAKNYHPYNKVMH